MFDLIGFAGRQHYSFAEQDTSEHDGVYHAKGYNTISIGPYDPRTMAAAILWRGNCDMLPSRYFYSERDQFPGQFDTDDLLYRLGSHSSAVDAVQLHPGYRITLFEK